MNPLFLPGVFEPFFLPEGLGIFPPIGAGNRRKVMPKNFEKILAEGAILDCSAAVGLTRVPGCRGVVIRAEDQAIRYLLTGTPTADAGNPIAAGEEEVFEWDSPRNPNIDVFFANFLLIEQSPSAKVRWRQFC